MLKHIHDIYFASFKFNSFPFIYIYLVLVSSALVTFHIHAVSAAHFATVKDSLACVPLLYTFLIT